MGLLADGILSQPPWQVEPSQWNDQSQSRFDEINGRRVQSDGFIRLGDLNIMAQVIFSLKPNESN